MCTNVRIIKQPTNTPTEADFRDLVALLSKLTVTKRLVFKRFNEQSIENARRHPEPSSTFVIAEPAPRARILGGEAGEPLAEWGWVKQEAWE